MGKPALSICENKAADQLHSNCAADQRLCFRYIDSTIPLLSKSEISSLKPSTVVVQPGLCRIWSETPKTGFLTTRLIYSQGQKFLSDPGCLSLWSACSCLINVVCIYRTSRNLVATWRHSLVKMTSVLCALCPGWGRGGACSSTVRSAG